MMRELQNAIRAQAAMASQGRKTSRLGIVSGYDPGSYSVKVTFPPDASETGWIPLAALAVGPGWGIYAPPAIGDQIEVRFQDGDRDAGIAGPVVYDNENPPASVPSQELWMVHKSGAFFKLTNDGKGSFSDSKGGSVTLNGDGTVSSTGTWTHTGTMTVSSDLTVNGSTSVKAITSNGHDISSTHKHTGVQTGGGISGTPQ